MITLTDGAETVLERSVCHSAFVRSAVTVAELPVVEWTPDDRSDPMAAAATISDLEALFSMSYRGHETSDAQPRAADRQATQ
jgi:hypothetical protein